MSYPIDIPGIGIVYLTTEAEVIKLRNQLKIITLEGDITHTNLDNQARGSLIDPLNPITNPEGAKKLSSGFMSAKLEGYTDTQWEKLFGETKYSPANIAAPTYNDSTSSVVNRQKSEEAKALARQIVYTLTEYGTTTQYNMAEFNQAFPENSIINPVQSGNAPVTLDTIYPPGTVTIPLDWQCGPMGGDSPVDQTHLCMGCPDAFCDDAANCGPGLAHVTTPCVNDILPPGPPPANWQNSELRLLGYISEAANGLRDHDIRTIRFRACQEAFCGGGGCCNCHDTATGLYCTGNLHYFTIMLDTVNFPGLSLSTLINRNMYFYTKWDEFILDIIANTSYGGAVTDTLADFEAWLIANDAALSGTPLNYFFGVASHLCSPGPVATCPPILPPPMPSWVGLSCDPMILSSYTNLTCSNATGACYANNSDGTITWTISCLDPLPASTGVNAHFEWSVTDGSAVVVHAGIWDGATNTITETVGSGIAAGGWHVTGTGNDFSKFSFMTDGLAMGTHTCNIFNFTGGGNNYGTYNIAGIVLNDPQQNCIINDPLYNANCCPPPPPPPPEPDEEPDHDCPCEGAENCEECGGQGINFKS
tara:strand:- start:3246 stop:5018 length:1773 start_codon:yes stop_codon:yes gene_type:complete